MIRKKYGTDDNFDIIINADKGDLEIWRFREIVDDNSEDIWDHDKVSLTEAKKSNPILKSVKKYLKKFSLKISEGVLLLRQDKHFCKR